MWYNMETTATIEVPTPQEFRERGVEEEKLARAVQRLLVLEVATMESKLTMEGALELADDVERSAWKSSQ